MKKHFIYTFALLGVLLLAIPKVNAQQQMQYTQFMFNPLVMNPAYAGVSGNKLNANFMSKWQWTGFEGAPFTGTMAIDSYLKNKNIGLGLILNTDEVTISKMSYLQLHYAYHINMRDSRLSFGLSGAMNNFRTNYNDLYLTDIDTHLSGNLSDWSTNFGAGAYYSRKNFNLSVSVPYFFNTEYSEQEVELYKQSRHYFISAGYEYHVSPNFSLQPNVLFKLVAGTPLSVDINTLAWLHDRAAVGLAYRPKESVDLLMQLKVNDEFKLGYSFDFIIDQTLSEASGNSHELMLSYALPWKKEEVKKDRDGDGVPDNMDLCPELAGRDENGCPLADADGDGVPDIDDKCPNETGPVEMEGCPDKDGDGIIDAKDKCPDEAGSEETGGCPDIQDTDGDGVPDSEDECPGDAGTSENNGCPFTDSDGDGIPDSEDKCPNMAGSATAVGCPDSDRDGVADNEDKCPDLAGISEENGCPEISEETKAVLQEALKGVQFEKGKDVLVPSSHTILDKVVEVMLNNPSYHLQISGYSDSSGDEQKNLELSKRRVASVKSYLIEKGITEDKLKSKGYGEENPIADNDTPEGRAKNRRVEFAITYE